MIALTSDMSQSSSFSVRLVNELMLEILCANIAFAINLPISEEACLVFIMFTPGLKSPLSSWKVCYPSSDYGVPIAIRSGLSRFAMAWPSARNSGIDTTENF